VLAASRTLRAICSAERAPTQALKALEEKGLVRARQGHGTTVTPPEDWNLLDPVVLEAMIHADETMQTLDQLVDVRVALECDMARTAASSITAAAAMQEHIRGTWQLRKLKRA
jgi:DNA-binding FadR family transcriptional regulator